jgi:phosphoglycolate phosphatase-like HAD superfamily hydrolase
MYRSGPAFFGDDDEVEGLLADLDQTLLKWVAYYCAFMRLALNLLAEKLQLLPEVVGPMLGRVLRKYQTHEYQHALAIAFAWRWVELGGSVEEFDALVQGPYHRLLLRVLRKVLTAPYDQVPQMLDDARLHGVRAVGVCSNGPLPMVLTRIKAAGLGDPAIINAVVAIEFGDPDEEDMAKLPTGPGLPAERWLHFGREFVQRTLAQSALPGIPCIGLPVSEMKPKPTGIQRLCDHFGLTPSRTMVVGDTISDVQAAQAAGCRAALATWDGWDRLTETQREMLDVRLGTPAGHTNGEQPDAIHILHTPGHLVRRLNGNGVRRRVS